MKNKYLRKLTDEEAEKQKCHWKETEDLRIAWKTECDYEFQAPNYTALTPDKDDFKYCPFCGSKISIEGN